MPDPYIVRFKVITLECASLKDGQQYIITYRRGDTFRSTPCYFCSGNTVDFSRMPEGAAVVHFKSGGARFQPKWIKFRVEEYTRGHPRQFIGETQVNCADILGQHNVSASAIRCIAFNLYGASAIMTVALLVCPQSHPSLSFDELLSKNKMTTGDTAHARSSVPASETRKMARDEAINILISLETMLERRREKLGKNSESHLERRVAELEERRRMLTSVEGMSSAVVKYRAEEVPAAQFTALSRKHRANFIGEVAAYLRQMAITSGVTLSNNALEELTLDPETARERLHRTNARIDSLSQQIRKFEEEKAALSRLANRVDTPSKTAAVVTKIETLQLQLQLIEKSRETLEGVVRGRDGGNALPIAREVQEIRARTRLLTAEEEQLRDRIRRMMSVAATHVLKWARSKNPPTENVRADFANLFHDETQQAGAQHKQGGVTTGDLNSAHRRQVVNGLVSAAQNQRPKKSPSPCAPSESSSSDSEVPRRQVEKPGTHGAKEPPSAGKLAGNKAKESNSMNPGLYVSDLSSDMFAPKSATKESVEWKSETDSPPMGKFPASTNYASQMPVLDFSPDVKENDSPSGVQSFRLDTRPVVFDTPPGSSSKRSMAPIVSVDIAPMYDFSATEDTDSARLFPYQTGESKLYSSFGVEGGVRTAMDISLKAPPLRTSFKFGPDEDADEDADAKVGSSYLPTYNFGGDSVPRSTYSGTPGLPTYNFGS